MTKKIELLSPGGDFDSVKSAISAGANAIYCGLSSFNARGRAKNLSFDDLKNAVYIAHQNNCKIYLTFNTIIFDDEIEEAFDIIKKACNLNIDGIIIQDYGLLYMVKECFPNLEVHASTQLTTHNEKQIEFLHEYGVKQINLSRELSLVEIKQLTQKMHSLGIKSEVFVHGAFCISFSGQCYMSENLTGHSGNRGECVQSCRRTYYKSKNHKEILPFNLKDNNLFFSSKKLIDAGVDSFKIEGRIKNFQYVYTVTNSWRKQLDYNLRTGKVLDDDSNLHKVFNRKFTDGYLNNNLSPNMFIDSSRDQSLIKVCKIEYYFADKKILKLQTSSELKNTDILLIYTSDFTFVCTGHVIKKNKNDEYVFEIEHKLKGKIEKNQVLYKLADTDQIESIKNKIEKIKVKKDPLSITVFGRISEKLKVIFKTSAKTVEVESDSILENAKSNPLNKDILTKKLGKLGDTNFKLISIDCSKLIGDLFIPIKEINQIRRNAISLITEDVANVNKSDPFYLIKSSVKKKQYPQSLYLVSNLKDINNINIENIVLEIPPYIKNRFDEYLDIFNNNRNIIPYFPPVLISDDFDYAVKLLESIDVSSRIITDNSGIAIVAEKLNINWIAGPLFNLANSFSFKSLSNFKFCNGAFLSLEVKRKQYSNIVVPENFDIYYLDNSFKLLMNSRQCLIRNIVGCHKKNMDEDCLASCNKKSYVHDKNNNKVLVIKRLGFYNQILYESKKHSKNIESNEGIFSFILFDRRKLI